MKVLDLFSGIGGFSLGLERAGMKTVAFCEIEPFPRAVLKKHWPEVPCYEDVRTLTADRLARDGIGPINVICGGFPCQDLSASGKQAGIDAERSGLWGEIVRLVSEIQPKFLIVENVANLIRGPIERPGWWFGRVLGELAEIGYDAEWDCVQASAIGLPHGRDRVWIVAYPDKVGRENPSFGLKTFRQPISRASQAARSSKPPQPVIYGVDDGVPGRVDRASALGNAVVPQIPEMIGRAIMEISQ